MSIIYTYEIIAVDEQARCMEVLYSAEGHSTMHIGTRLPFEEEAIEDVIKAYAPVALWLEQARVVIVPQVGAMGTIEPDTKIETNLEFESSDEISATESQD